MVNNLSAQKNLPALRLAGFSYLVLFFLHLSGNASDQVISFSVLPQEHFLLDILGVPLVGMQSIRRDLVGLLQKNGRCLFGTGEKSGGMEIMYPDRIPE